MDLQKVVDAMMAQGRAENLAQSSQLLLGELKLKLEMVKDKSKPIVFDFGPKPAGACSWRGAYQELGLEYSAEGGGSAVWNSDVITYESEYGNSYEQETVTMPSPPTAGDFLAMLEALTDQTMVGYKGGDYTMHKNVAVYLGNYGESGVSLGGDYKTIAVADIVEGDKAVTIVTIEIEY